MSLSEKDDPGYVADFIAQNIYLRHSEKQKLLEELRPFQRLTLLGDMLSREIEIIGLEQNIQASTQEHIAKNQKDYYLREQIKVIQEELGEGEGAADELAEYRKRIAAVGFPKESEDKLLRELNRLAKQPYASAESAVLRSYLDACLELPWNKRTTDVRDIVRARRTLDADHFGLAKVKERVIEYLAVRQLTPELKGGVLCLVGPPGVGKTSVAVSIARATNRKLARISLGGVHDEAEIRGHRKTYVGAMPGRIMAGVRQAGSCNPVIVLDEIDKLGSDYRGDPSAALLEALDQEQNYAFRDHYLEIPFDLSEVFFITTANTTETIPRALLDRMEVIEMGSYTDEEKLQIAKTHLLPKQRKKHGLNGNQLRLSDDAIREIIARYTRESGVRTLERELAAVCRKTARGIADGSLRALRLHAGELEAYLGPVKFKPDPLRLRDEVGLVHGLAWTQVGGEVLDVECSVVPGSGSLELTGNLGDVMKESARAAVTYIRSRVATLGIDPEFYKNRDIHIHFPEGATPKDGPSAGIAICVCVISALTGVPVNRDIAMTGEITLRGRILPIGGLREKTMAALRAGIHQVILPADNESDLRELDPAVRNALNFTTADHLDKILDLVLRPCLREASAARSQEAIMLPAEVSEHNNVGIRQ
jgi:ATP-dependent Lon protease